MQAPEWVRERLDNWGRWMSERGTSGLGFPRSNVIAAYRGGSASADFVPVDSVAAGHTHRAVQLLRGTDDRAWMAVTCRYVGNPQVRPGQRRPMLHTEIAALLQVSEPTARGWVLGGELAVMQTLDRWQMRPAIG